MQTYIDSIRDTPLLTADQELALFERIQCGDMEARDEMIRANLLLVVSIACQSRGAALGLRDDCIEEGNVGVIHATESFDPVRFQTRFSTYATYWIRQSIRQFLFNQGCPIKLNSTAHNIVVKWDRAATVLESKLGRKPDDREVADFLKVSHKKMKIVQRFKLARGILRECELEGRWEDTVGAAKFGNLSCEERELFDKVNVFIEDLTERERAVINMRFGLNGYEVLNYREISKVLGISHEWVRKTEVRVIESFKVIGSLHNHE